MTKINLPHTSFSYPVGTHIATNSRIVLDRFQEFRKIADDDLRAATVINLVCMGSSGAIVATMFYLGLSEYYTEAKIRIVHIKKHGEESHSSRVPHLDGARYHANIFVDDFMDSGDTFMETLLTIRDDSVKLRDFQFLYTVLMGHTTPDSRKRIEEVNGTRFLLGEVRNY